MLINSDYTFLPVPEYKNRLAPKGIEDPRKKKPGIRIYGEFVGKILSLFKFAVKLEAKNANGELQTWYVNYSSLNDWKKRQQKAHRLHADFDFNSPKVLDQFIQSVRADINANKAHQDTLPSLTEAKSAVKQNKTSIPKETALTQPSVNDNATNVATDQNNQPLEEQNKNSIPKETASAPPSVNINATNVATDQNNRPLEEQNKTSTSPEIASTQPNQALDPSGVINSNLIEHDIFKAKLIELKDVIFGKRNDEKIEWDDVDHAAFMLKDDPQSLFVTDEDQDVNKIWELNEQAIRVCRNKNLDLIKMSSVDRFDFDSRFIYKFTIDTHPNNQDQLWDQKKDKLVESFKQLTQLVLTTQRPVDNLAILDEESNGAQKIFCELKKSKNKSIDELLFINDDEYPQGLLTYCKTQEQVLAVLKEASVEHAAIINKMINDIYISELCKPFPSSKFSAPDRQTAVIETILYKNRLSKKYNKEGLTYKPFKPIQVNFDTLDMDLHEEGITINKQSMKKVIETIVEALNRNLEDHKRDAQRGGDFTDASHRIRHLLLSSQFDSRIRYIEDQDYDPSGTLAKGQWIRRILTILQKGGYVIDFKKDERDHHAYWEVQI